MEKTSLKKIKVFQLWLRCCTAIKKQNRLFTLTHILLSLFAINVLITGCKKSQTIANPFLGITVYNDFKTHPDTFIFKAESTIPCNYKWNFNDGSMEISGDSVMHIFDYGFFDVMLKGKLLRANLQPP